ncbi:methylenetetrahydrofolate reductase [Dactylosporangium sp. CA-092794]|uniref:methylenetetrahydrofolate reductase n=1 Tax=Dactylosporangium sp. CA-092794 TaxID=3239929 RepID=UPI003D8A3A74
MGSDFEIVCEIEPPTRPDIRHVRHQIGVLGPVAHAFLIPDNHIGRATVSSIAVAHEVAAMGGRSIACLNSRDRNLLGFQRDMLTAAAYGVDEFLFVHGDKPTAGDRAADLTVRTMMAEARSMGERPGFTRPRIGVAAGLRRVPSWKRDADFVFAQMSFSLDALLRWRDETALTQPVYAGVLVLASAGMARRLSATIPDIDIPSALVDRVEADPRHGVAAACEHLEAVRATGAFAGVHLVTVSRYREIALALEP